MTLQLTAVATLLGMARVREPRPTAERFWEKTERQPNGCLYWTAVKGDHGYGRFRADGRTPLAHRFAYELVNGPIPQGFVVRHTCDTRCCVEPTHLILGTPSDNTLDAADRGLLWQTSVTHCPKGHPYSGANLAVTQSPNGRVRRICRACRQERNWAHYRKRVAAIPTASRPSAEERFRAKLERQANGCLYWTGTTRYGYGALKVDGRTVRAHRFAYELAQGPIPEGAIILHSCDEPRCCEPTHLRVGSPSTNMLDASAKGRHGQARKDRCPQGHLYEEHAGRYRRTADGGPRRLCLECMRLQKRTKREAARTRAKECLNAHPWDAASAVLVPNGAGRQRRVCPICLAPLNNARLKCTDPETHCANGHHWDEENTVIVVRADGTTQRRCRACRTAHKRAWRAARKAAGLPHD